LSERPHPVNSRENQADSTGTKKAPVSLIPVRELIPPPALSLSAFLSTMEARINRLNDAAAEPVTLRAIPIKPPAHRKSYNGRVYCGLKDPVGRETVDATVAESQIESVPWGVEATLTGLVVYRVSPTGKIEPLFRIDSVFASGHARVRPREELEKRWGEAIRRPKRKLIGAFLVDRPRVVLITGVTSVAADDIQAQLGVAEEFVDLQVVRVAVTQPAEVAAALRNATAANLVVIARGGGHEVEYMDDDTLLDAVARSPVPVAVALGHATDKLVLDQVADCSFPTPTALGTWMRATIEQRRAHLREVQEDEALKAAGGLRAQLQALQESNKLLNENLEKAARSRQEVEEKLLAQQKQLLDQAEAARVQLAAAQKENEQLKTLREGNADLSKTVEDLRAELVRSTASARFWTRVAVAAGLVCLLGVVAFLLTR
jgi:exodeoxyribonuclease VII large subunit